MTSPAKSVTCHPRRAIEDGDLSADAYGELGGAFFHVRLPLWVGEWKAGPEGPKSPKRA